MPRTRVKLEVYVDLDPMPGTFHSLESARNVVGNILTDRIEHYNPMVSVGLQNELKIAEIKNTAAVLKVRLDRLQPAGDTLKMLLAQIEEL